VPLADFIHTIGIFIMLIYEIFNNNQRPFKGGLALLLISSGHGQRNVHLSLYLKKKLTESYRAELMFLSNTINN